MALNTFKCNYLTPVHFKGLNDTETSLAYSCSRLYIQRVSRKDQQYFVHKFDKFKGIVIVVNITIVRLT